MKVNSEDFSGFLGGAVIIARAVNPETMEMLGKSSELASYKDPSFGGVLITNAGTKPYSPISRVRLEENTAEIAGYNADDTAPASDLLGKLGNAEPFAVIAYEKSANPATGAEKTFALLSPVSLASELAGKEFYSPITGDVLVAEALADDENSFPDSDGGENGEDDDIMADPEFDPKGHEDPDELDNGEFDPTDNDDITASSRRHRRSVHADDDEPGNLDTDNSEDMEGEEPLEYNEDNDLNSNDIEVAADRVIVGIKNRAARLAAKQPRAVRRLVDSLLTPFTSIKEAVELARKAAADFSKMKPGEQKDILSLMADCWMKKQYDAASKILLRKAVKETAAAATDPEADKENADNLVRELDAFSVNNADDVIALAEQVGYAFDRLDAQTQGEVKTAIDSVDDESVSEAFDKGLDDCALQSQQNSRGAEQADNFDMALSGEDDDEDPEEGTDDSEYDTALDADSDGYDNETVNLAGRNCSEASVTRDSSASEKDAKQFLEDLQNLMDDYDSLDGLSLEAGHADQAGEHLLKDATSLGYISDHLSPNTKAKVLKLINKAGGDVKEELLAAFKKGVKAAKNNTPMQEISVDLTASMDIAPFTITSAEVATNKIAVFAFDNTSRDTVQIGWLDRTKMSSAEQANAALPTINQAVIAAVESGDDLSAMGFTPVTASFSIPSYVEEKVSKEVAKKTMSIDRDLENTKERYRQSLGMAVAAMAKGHIANPMVDVLASSLNAAGLPNARVQALNIASKATSKVMSSAIEQAAEYDAYDDATRNAVANTIKKSRSLLAEEASSIGETASAFPSTASYDDLQFNAGNSGLPETASFRNAGKPVRAEAAELLVTKSLF